LKIITRKEAEAAGLVRFFTGQTCIYGHTSERYTYGGHCISCLRMRNRQRDKAGALKAGVSVKTYRASRLPSVSWGYVAEVIRRRCKKNGVLCTITPASLKQQYEVQQGMCPITGWKLEPKSGSGLCPTTMTVDRISNKAGYTSENIQLVCFVANNAKYVWSHQQLLDFCRAVIAHNKRKS